jgi:hypothetical protein
VVNTLEIQGERKVKDKITALKNLSKSYEMRMRGFHQNTTGDSWYASGVALAGEDFIRQSSGILNSFTESVNLITDKDREKFVMEFLDAFYRVNTMALNDPTVPTENYRAVIKMFKDTLSNTGDVITGSKGMFDKVFHQQENNSMGDFDE